MMGLPTDIRKNIRDNVKIILEDAEITENIFKGRIDPIPVEKLPAINIHVLEDEAEETPDATGYIKFYILSIFCIVKGQDEIQVDDIPGTPAIEQADALSDKVFSALAKINQTLNKTVRRCVYAGSNTEISGDGENRILSRKTSWATRIEVSLP